jgi:hypothetical protein
MDSSTTNLLLFIILMIMIAILVIQKRTNHKYLYFIMIAFLALFTIANIIVYNRSHETKPPANAAKKLTTRREPRIFCIIFTAPKKFGEQRPFTVLNIWATKCDNYRFVTVMPNGTNYTRTKSDSLEIGEPLNIMQPRGFVKENYWKLTSKVFMTFKQLNDEYGSEYDWFLKGKILRCVLLSNMFHCFKNLIF